MISIWLPCGAGAADHLVAVGLHAGGQAVHGFSASGAEGDVDESGPGKPFFRIVHGGPGHDLQAGAAVKGEKIGAEAGGGIVVFIPAGRSKVGLEKISGCRQVIDVHGHVFDIHRDSSCGLVIQ